MEDTRERDSVFADNTMTPWHENINGGPPFDEIVDRIAKEIK